MQPCLLKGMVLNNSSRGLCSAESWCFADLFAIVKTTEKLERAYVRDTISAKDYELLCEKLIAQFRTLWETLRDTVSFQRSIR